jgi:hypothetical protein
MIVELTCPDGSGTKEWFLIEMQGKITTIAGSGFDGVVMGEVTLKPVSQPGLSPRAGIPIPEHRPFASPAHLPWPRPSIHPHFAGRQGGVAPRRQPPHFGHGGGPREAGGGGGEGRGGIRGRVRGWGWGRSRGRRHGDDYGRRPCAALGKGEVCCEGHREEKDGLHGPAPANHWRGDRGKVTQERGRR